ncbi:MAG: DnaB-like helicase C-terminal domain-containing protein [Oscillospiraceae bacterium]
MAVSKQYDRKMFEHFRLNCDLNYLLDKYPKCIKTGYASLDDKICGGLLPGLIVLGGASSLGKSTFALNLATNISKNNIPVLYYSLEMSSFSIAEKNIFRSSRVNDSLSKNIITQSKFDEFARSAEKNKVLKSAIDEAAGQSREDNRNLYIIDYEAVSVIENKPDQTSSISADFIIEYTKNVFEWFKEEQRIDNPSFVVIVDYLQILGSSAENDNRTDKQIIDENIRKLWVLSHEINVPVLVISSVNRDAYEKPISLSSFKESGNIEYTADLILGMQFELFGKGYSDIKKSDIPKLVNEEKEKETRSIEIRVLKNRFGPTGKPVGFSFEANSSCFFEKGSDETSGNSSERSYNEKNYRQNRSETKKKSDVKGILI